jgi:ApaG protein
LSDGSNAVFFPVSAAEKILELPGLRVTVDRVLYQPDALTPPDRPHCFVYYITIHNDSNATVTIRGRKWVVTNEGGDITAVEGEGVVGQHPRMEPGEKFSYNSFHLLDTRSAAAEGSYLGIDANGRKVLTRIPRFEMVVPEGNWGQRARQ